MKSVFKVFGAKRKSNKTEFNDVPIACAYDPQKATTHYNLGCVLQAQGRPLEAVACYKDCIKYDHTHPDAHYNLAGALQDLNILLEAEK